MRSRIFAVITAPAVILATLVFTSCSQREVEPGGTYYERKIAPILISQCATSPTGSSCHVTADDRGNALGNLDVTTHELIAKRRDLLTNYGPYGMPALLMKAVPDYSMRITHWDGTYDTVTKGVPHAGGTLIEVGTPSFSTLSRWIERGATENNVSPKKTQQATEPCVERVGHDSLFDPTKDPGTPDYQVFLEQVNPFLVQNCAGANCHGVAEGAMMLSCGKTDEQKRWNYFSAKDYVATDASQSELIRRVLDPAFGGTYHEGGHFFDTPEDGQYKAIEDWARQLGGPTNIPPDPGFEFFAKRVQPMLAKRGCLQLGCHSTPAFPGFSPRGGSNGYFSLPTTRANYRQSLKQLAIESPDPNASRLLRKNLPPAPTGFGILHRGGPLFAAGGDPSVCDRTAAETGPLDDQDPYCVIVTWLEKEQADRQSKLAPLSGIVYVRRPPAALPARVVDFEAYNPGADLRLAAASMDATGNVTLSGGDTSLTAGCGLATASADIRRPQVAWDGSKITFAARSAASEPLRVYVMNADGSNCAVDSAIDAPAVDDEGKAVPTNGELVHNFDPAFAPDGTLVFASTRGNTMNTAAFDYAGPQRTPADPAKLNSNLYVLEGGKIRQLTFLLNQELQPSFKSNGQVLFTTEKRAPGFHQLAARRINLDGGDYHPLIGQRQSFGFQQVTDIIHLFDLNFAVIASEFGAVHEAGTLVLVNRSLGPDHRSEDPDDYTQNPDAITYPSPNFFQRSLTFLDSAATGRVTGSTKGAYRNPAPLPNGHLLVSYAANVVDLSNFSGNFDVVVVNTATGARTPLPGLSDPSQDEIWAVPVYGRYSRGVFRSSPADPTGSAVIYTENDGQPRTDRAQLTYLDFPLITSLMFQNTRSGRFVPKMSSFDLWESLPPENEKSLSDSSAYIVDDKYGKLYSRRRLVGNVPLQGDGSVRVQIPGGLPVIIGTQAQFAGENSPSLHHQMEEVQYYPGEWVTLSFRRELFNGFCGGCHGSISGKEHDVAVNPDVLTQASNAAAKKSVPLDVVNAKRGDSKAPPYP